MRTWEDFKKDAKRLVVICIASVLYALNIKIFVRTGGLFPGGATGLTILIQAGEVDTGIETIVTATGEKEPAAASAPVVQALSLRAVHGVHRTRLASLHVE